MRLASAKKDRIYSILMLGVRMRIFFIIKSVFWGILIKLFPSLGAKGIIDTQIKVYKKLMNKFPEASENDLLNSLIMSRVNAPFSTSTIQNEYANYESMIQNPNKTLEDVIWAIVEYELLLSRGEKLFEQLSIVKAQPTSVIEELKEWRKYIEECVKKLRDT